jgi:hypothetical protein
MNDRHLTYCCPGCRRVKDQNGNGGFDHDWCTMSDYVMRHPVPNQNVTLAEFYCTDCSMSYDRLVEYSRTANPARFL